MLINKMAAQPKVLYYLVLYYLVGNFKVTI